MTARQPGDVDDGDGFLWRLEICFDGIYASPLVGVYVLQILQRLIEGVINLVLVPQRRVGIDRLKRYELVRAFKLGNKSTTTGLVQPGV